MEMRTEAAPFSVRGFFQKPLILTPISFAGDVRGRPEWIFEVDRKMQEGMLRKPFLSSKRCL